MSEGKIAILFPNLSAIFSKFVFQAVQGSARVHNIKKTWKTWEWLIFGRGLWPDEYSCFQVDGSITRGAYDQNFTAFDNFFKINES